MYVHKCQKYTIFNYHRIKMGKKIKKKFKKRNYKTTNDEFPIVMSGTKFCFFR